jgi:8-oxo-dGTP diphosphatase
VTRAEVCVGAVVVSAGHLLLVRRGRPPGAGAWSVPGGRVETGETLSAAVRREVLEETGVDVEPGPLVGWAERINADYHFVILDFAATPRLGELPSLTAGDDASDARWVPLPDVRSLPLVEGLAQFLELHGVLDPVSPPVDGGMPAL